MSEIDELREEIRRLTFELHLVSRVNSIRAKLDASGKGSGVQQEAARLAPVAAAPRGSRSWRHMTPVQASEAWDELTGFADWLVNRYELTDSLPACWYRHGAMVEELHALHLAWAGAYVHVSARPVDPAHWHELLHRALNRLREWDRYGCAAGTHRDNLGNPISAAVLEERDAFIRDDNRARAARDGQPDQVPTPSA